MVSSSPQFGQSCGLELHKISKSIYKFKRNIENILVVILVNDRMHICKQRINLLVIILNKNYFLAFQITFQTLEKMADRRLQNITAIDIIFV